MNKLILAIDQGTSGTKSVLFDDQGKVVGKASNELASYYPEVGFVEQGPNDIYFNALNSVVNCLANVPEAAEKVAAVGISNQRETFLLWDKNGDPLTRAISWQCKRSVNLCERLKGTDSEAEIKARTGLIVDPYFSGSKLAWLINNNPKVKEAVKSGNAYFGTIDTWILYRLTKGSSYYTDYTNASRTLLFNIHTLAWDETLLEIFGAKGLNLPIPRPSSSKFGKSDFDMLFPWPVPITGMIGDSHAAAFGEGCFAPGEAKATLGTGSSILCNVGSKPKTSQEGMVSTISWSTENRVDYALEGVIVTCGATVKWLRDQLELFESNEETEAMAESVEDNGGVYLIPAFSGMGAPHWKMDAKASIVGLTFGADKNHVARAALESVAFQIKDVITAMEKDSGTPLSELKLDGGMTSNRMLMQLIADLLGVRIVTIGMEEVSALGAAYMAGLEMGIFESVDALKSLQTEQEIFEPGNGELIKAAHEIWREMIAKHC